MDQRQAKDATAGAGQALMKEARPRPMRTLTAKATELDVTGRQLHLWPVLSGAHSSFNFDLWFPFWIATLLALAIAKENRSEHAHLST